MNYTITTNYKKIEISEAKDEEEATRIAEAVLLDDEVIIMVATKTAL